MTVALAALLGAVAGGWLGYKVGKIVGILSIF